MNRSKNVKDLYLNKGRYEMLSLFSFLHPSFFLEEIGLGANFQTAFHRLPCLIIMLRLSLYFR